MRTPARCSSVSIARAAWTRRSGITDVDQPTTYTDSRAYVNNQNSDTMLARDGGAFTPVGTWSENAWQCVWIVADNASDEIAVYSHGGAYEEQTRLPDGPPKSSGSERTSQRSLDRFFWINGSSSNGTLMLDDVAVDNTGENLANPTGNPADCAFTGRGGSAAAEPASGPSTVHAGHRG